MKNMKTVTLLAASAFILGSSALFAAQQKDDTSITNEVKSKITSTANIPATSSPNVVIYTKDGKVSITGSVATKAQKKEIEQAVKNLKDQGGIKNFDLDLKVLSE